MKLTEQEILELIQKGENNTIVFKEFLVRQADLARDVSALANSQGGIILVGVSKDKLIVEFALNIGIQQSYEDIKNMLFSLVPGLFNIEIAEVYGTFIFYIIIKEADEGSKPILTSQGEEFFRYEGKSIKKRREIMSFSKSTKNLYVESNLQGFVAMSFRTEEEPSLQDYYQAMVRAAKRVDPSITLIRMDLIEGDFEISQQIMDEIEKANFVITDFTLNSENVYFEAGFARGVKKTVIYTARRGQELKFDIRNWRTLLYRNATELEELLYNRFQNLVRELT